MDFRKATDDLCMAITHDDVARQLGVSVQSIRQARMKSDSRGRRAPPENWEKALALLAENRIAAYRQLIERLQDMTSSRIMARLVSRTRELLETPEGQMILHNLVAMGSRNRRRESAVRGF